MPALDEQETTFTIEATDRHVVNVFSNDPVWQERMAKVGIVWRKSDAYGKWYVVPLNEFNFTIRKKKQLTDEEKAKLREQFAKGRAGSDGDDSEDA